MSTTKQYFFERPLGRKIGNYALNRQQVEDILKDFTGVEEKEDDIWRITEFSPFGNGALAKIEFESTAWHEWILKRPEIRA